MDSNVFSNFIEFGKIIMAAPLFSKHWYDKAERDQKTAMTKFHAAVASARTGADEAVRQVLLSSVLSG